MESVCYSIVSQDQAVFISNEDLPRSGLHHFHPITFGCESRDRCFSTSDRYISWKTRSNVIFAGGIPTAHGINKAGYTANM